MSAEKPPLFIDTWGWIALADASEPAHAAVTALRKAYSNHRRGWATSDYVLNETITRVFARRPFEDAKVYCDALVKAAELGFVEVQKITNQRFREAYRMSRGLSDKPRIPFTDLTSMCAMKDPGLQHVVTADRRLLQVGLGFGILP